LKKLEENKPITLNVEMLMLLIKWLHPSNSYLFYI